jgi:cytoskeletal protein CcmA (bactofilin family)
VLEVKRKPASHSHGTATTRALAPTTPARASTSESQTIPAIAPSEFREFQAKVPVITGEIHFKGVLPVDGILTGQIGAGSSLNLRQRPSASFATQAELTGDLTFKDMVRVNGHVAGTIYSKTGTLIVDASACVESNINVVAAIISGTVKGDIIARDRVELGPAAKIYGNIWTRSLVIKDGAIFEGVCRMIGEVQKVS